MVRRGFRILLIAVVLAGIGWFALTHALACYHLRAGRNALATYHSTEAREHFEQCLSRWPSDAQARLGACRAARRLGEYDEAKQHLKKVQRLAPVSGDDDVAIEWGLLRAAMGDLDGIEENIEKRADTDPAAAPLILEALAEGYMRMYRIRDSLVCLDKWQYLQPENPQVFFLRGNLWRQLKGFKRAVTEYERVLDLDSARLDARWWLALCLAQNGRFNDAAAHLEIARKQGSTDVDAQVLLARCYGRLERMPEADKLLDEVLEQHPDHALALKARGHILQLAQKPADAEMWLRRALEVMPHDYEINWGLFQVLQQQKKSAQAREQSICVEKLRKCLERLDEMGAKDMPARPHDPSLHCEMGLLLLHLDHKDLGCRWLMSALHEDPKYHPAQTALAAYFESQGDLEKAAQYRRLAQGP